jgi:hypothetical protein
MPAGCTEMVYPFFLSSFGGRVILLLSFLSSLQFNIVPELLRDSIGLMSKVTAFVNLIDKFCKLHWQVLLLLFCGGWGG